MKKKLIITSILIFMIAGLSGFFIYQSKLKPKSDHRASLMDKQKKRLPLYKEILTTKDFKTSQFFNDGTAFYSVSPSPQIGLPKFTLYKEDGSTLTLSGFKGKPILIGYWAEWCAPCIKSLPDLNKLSKELKGSVNFVLINIDYFVNSEIDLTKIKQVFNKYAPDMTLYTTDPKKSLMTFNDQDKENFIKIFFPVDQKFPFELTIPFYHLFNKNGYEIARVIQGTDEGDINWHDPGVKARFLKLADNNKKPD